MTLDSETIQRMKNLLEEEKKRIEAELLRFAKPTNVQGDFETSFENIGDDRDENALEVENYQENLALEQTLENRLHKILHALEQIKNGDYGKCTLCANDIEEARLTANPEADVCMACIQEGISI